MRKWIIRIGLFLILLAVLAFIFRSKITEGLMKSMMAPTDTYAAYTPPAAPDYSDDQSWAALPNTEDQADVVPVPEEMPVSVTDVAAFFIHPTTYFSKAAWNAPVDDPDSSKFVEEGVLPGQASVFNGCCDVYAPRYRQATLWSFSDDTGSGEKALEFAYADVERAFDAFLIRIGDRPFILAGHSQGGRHLETLLKRKVSGTPLAGRMIAAYPVGFGIRQASMTAEAPDIPVCQSAIQTGCYVTWNAMGPKAVVWENLPGSVCVNPLSWKQDGVAVPASQNGGSLGVSSDLRYEAGVSGAQCLEDRLLVGPFSSDIYKKLPVNMGKDNYHVVDYGLFYTSIRQNAIDRANAYLKAK